MTSRPRALHLPFLLPAVLLLLGYGIAQILWGELISAGRGIGWDGRFYVPVVQDFRQAVLVDRLDAYRLQRIVPPALVGAAMRRRARMY